MDSANRPDELWRRFFPRHRRKSAILPAPDLSFVKPRADNVMEKTDFVSTHRQRLAGGHLRALHVVIIRDRVRDRNGRR